MPQTAHLPKAIQYEADDDLATLDDDEVLRLVEECDAWRDRAKEFSTKLSTPAARTLWKALAKSDFDRVDRTCKRLRAEALRRGL